MAIAPKPKRSDETSSAEIDAIIAKGGSVADGEETNRAGQGRVQEVGQDGQKANSEPTSANEAPAPQVGSFTLRVPSALLQELDEHRKARRVKVSRQQWILEAIEQRLQNESSGAGK